MPTHCSNPLCYNRRTPCWLATSICLPKMRRSLPPWWTPPPTAPTTTATTATETWTIILMWNRWIWGTRPPHGASSKSRAEYSPSSGDTENYRWIDFFFSTVHRGNDLLAGFSVYTSFVSFPPTATLCVQYIAICENPPHKIFKIIANRSQLEEKEQTLAEVKNKFSRNRQILTSNWEQAETEVILIYFSFGPYCG